MMIQVAGRPLQLDSLPNLGRVERAIVQMMIAAPDTLTYPSMRELLFELQTRINIMDAAREMSEGEAAFTTFEYHRANPAFWSLTHTGGFQLRRGVSPADAITDVFRNSSQYAFECATAVVIIFYYGVLKSIGKRSFDALFQNLYLYSWHTDPDLDLYTTYADYFFPGDVVYFNNPDFHPNASWYRGENAVVMTDGMFFGHGFGIMTGKQMIDFLNTQRFPGSTRPAYLTSLVTKISAGTIQRLANLPANVPTFRKSPRPLVHHNRCSICIIEHQHYCSKKD